MLLAPKFQTEPLKRGVPPSGQALAGLLLALAAFLPLGANAQAPGAPTVLPGGATPLNAATKINWRFPTANTTVQHHQYRYVSKALTDSGDFPSLASKAWQTLALSATNCLHGSTVKTGSACATYPGGGHRYWTDLPLVNGLRYEFEFRYVTTAATNNQSESVRFRVALPANPTAAVDLSGADAEFVKRVRAARGLSAGHVITQLDMARLLRFEVRDRSSPLPPRIRNLNGLQHALNLVSVNITHHQITEIPQLLHLFDLDFFAFQGSLLADVSPLRHMTNLERIYLNRGDSRPPPGFNVDTGIVRDFSQLSRLTKLWTLFICDQNVNPQHLTPFTDMRVMSYCRNDLSDISPMRGLTKMQTLYLFENRIEDASPLSVMTDLTFLHLHDNRIRDISSFGTLTKLTRLFLSDNPLDAGSCSVAGHATRTACEAASGGVWTSGVVAALSPLVTGSCSIPSATTEAACTTAGAGATWTDGVLRLIDLRGDTQLTDDDISALRGLTPPPVVLHDSDIRPAAPQLLAAGEVGGRVRLSWRDPSDSDIVAYQYRHRPSSSGSWSEWKMSVEAPESSFHAWTQDNATRTALNVAGLTGGTYDFELRALVASDFNNASTTRTFLDAGQTPSTVKSLQSMLSGISAGRYDVGRVLTPGPATSLEFVRVGTDEPDEPEPPPPPPTNAPPRADDELADLALAVGATETVDLSGAFRDPEGAALTHSAASSDEAVATVSVEGATLTVTAAAAGEATVTVTAEDAGGLEASQSFRVTVTMPPPPNLAPEAVGELADLTLTVGATAPVDLSGAFRDPEGGDLTHSAASSDEAVATVSVEGARVTVTAVAAGEATVTVMATDAGGLAASQSFAVAVSAPQPPSAGALADLELMADGESAVVRLAQVFEASPGGAPLSFSAESSAPSLASVTVEGEVLTVAANDQGEAGVVTVRVTATDSRGLATTAEFQVTVLTPRRSLLGRAWLLELLGRAPAGEVQQPRETGE